MSFVLFLLVPCFGRAGGLIVSSFYISKKIKITLSLLADVLVAYLGTYLVSFFHASSFLSSAFRYVCNHATHQKQAEAWGVHVIYSIFLHEFYRVLIVLEDHVPQVCMLCREQP